MKQLKQGEAEVIYTEAGQRVIKNVKGSSSKYYPTFKERSKKVIVRILTNEEYDDIASKLISQISQCDVTVNINNKKQWETIQTKFWKELTYGDMFPNIACDGSGEFGHGICKFELI